MFRSAIKTFEPDRPAQMIGLHRGLDQAIAAWGSLATRREPARSAL